MTERLYDGTLIDVDDIHRSFGSGERAVHVLRGLSLEVEAGNLIALYGPSGSGKTTLLNLIGTLDRPNKGSIKLLGKDIVRMRDGRRARIRRKKIGFIFQNYTLIPTYTSAENVDLALRLPGWSYFKRRNRTRTAIEAVGLSAWADHMPGQLSGGQRQRVAIARALALRPAIILADEPTSGLDTRTARRILSLFRGIAQAQGTAFLIVSHDPLVVDYVDTAYDLHEGKLKPRFHSSTLAPPAEENLATAEPDIINDASSDDNTNNETSNDVPAETPIEAHTEEQGS